MKSDGRVWEEIEIRALAERDERGVGIEETKDREVS